MARFDVHVSPGNPAHYVLDVQADLLGMLNTRVVVPLLPIDAAPMPAEILNPVFEIEAQRFVMLTQFIAAIPRKELGEPVTSLKQHDYAIGRALDFLTSGV